MSATFSAKLGGGTALSELNATLLSFNNTASRKRAAEGGGSDGEAGLRLPSVVYGDKRPRTSFNEKLNVISQRPPTPPPGRDGASAGSGLGARMGDHQASIVRTKGVPLPTDTVLDTGGGFKYNLTAAREHLANSGGRTKCVHALLCAGIRNDHAREDKVRKLCPSYGTDGHTGHGAAGKGKHKPHAGFNAAEFRVA